ncbi:carboxypeptidase-like regulatory domain-containing protein [Deinococcus ruber]|uniref:Carboxypeptidase regulatory-like domain-containing protein n=1 Tax=Deinococcus ruber TaxID=1848197 RepID=A0A918F9X2_9DEIO|nr:carboxypeptidase-like regulatory domain-containing protein [Deinococcus ruber]GGR19397.1 hypothetical protein GCM10008957_34880 [Deinococcus ruber]
MKHAVTLGLVLALSLSACTTSTPPTSSPGGGDMGGTGGGGNTGGGGGTSSGPLQPEPGKVKGTAVDTQGQPLQGTLVWMLPSVADGVVQTHTNAQGQYVTPTLPDEPFDAYAWQQVPYRGQTFCVRLAAASADQYAPFSPKNGVIRTFKWQLTGRMPDQNHDNAYFGAEVRLMNGSWNDTQPLSRDASVEVTLTPDGPLIDGSTGQTMVRTVSFYDGFLYDLPVGHYTVTAAEVQPDGTHTPLVLNGGSGPERFQSTLDFQAEGGPCGGYGGSNGVERALIELARTTQ